MVSTRIALLLLILSVDVTLAEFKNPASEKVTCNLHWSGDSKNFYPRCGATKEVVKFLAEIKMEKYAPNFHERGYTLLEDMLRVEQSELATDLGVGPLPHQRRILAHAAAIVAQQAQPSALRVLASSLAASVPPVASFVASAVATVGGWCMAVVGFALAELVWFLKACFVAALSCALITLLVLALLLNNHHIRKSLVGSGGAVALTVWYHCKELHQRGQLGAVVERYAGPLRLRPVIALARRAAVRVEAEAKVLGALLQPPAEAPRDAPDMSEGTGLKSAPAAIGAGPVAEAVASSPELAQHVRVRKEAKKRAFGRLWVKRA